METTAMELVTANKQGKDVTTSLMVAKVFGKNHQHILRDIDNMECSAAFRASNFGLSSYTSLQNKELPMYEITRDGFSFLVMGYTGAKAAEFKEMFIREFNRRTAMLQNDDYIIQRAQDLLAGRVKALETAVAKKNEILALQEHTIMEQAPKVEYHDQVLAGEGLIVTNIIAKELGMSAVTLNRLLHEMGIIYKSGDTWVLYNRYQDRGLTGTKTFPYLDSQGEIKTRISLCWTEAGRKFIHAMIEARHAQKSLKIA